MAVTVRFVEPSDAAAIRAIYAPYCESTYVSFEIVAPSIAEMTNRIRRISSRYPWLVCDVDGELVGYVYASQHGERAAYRWAVDVAVYVDARFQRCGIGRGLYTALFSVLQEQGYFKAYAGITLPNEKSVGLHEAVGFRQAGVFPHVGYKLGKWLDVGWWQRELQPEATLPDEPRSIEIVRRSPSVEQTFREASAGFRERLFPHVPIDSI